MTDLSEKLKTLAKRIETIKDSISTEEATKTSIIMPFFQALGYDVFNPNEFTPEYVADVGIKKGEKVDYAILNNGNPVILIEAKSINEKLSKHDSQLFRYFGTSSAKFAILTNGITYRFYTDLDEQNKMDDTPFFEFNILEMKESQLIELAKFRKESFDLQKIFNTASELKFTIKIKSYLYTLWEEPDEEFVSFIISNIYNGRKTKNVLDQFSPIIKKSFKQFINELVNDKLNAALKSTSSEEVQEKNNNVEITEEPNKPVIKTTEEEIQGYGITKIILSDIIDEDRVFYRDNQSYFNILIDDSIRKWVCRLGLNSNHKYIQFNDENKTTFNIEKISEIMKYKHYFLDVAKKYQ